MGKPDFSREPYSSYPDVRFVPAPRDNTFPDGFYSSTNFPTYAKVNGKWRLPKEPRMDSGLYYDSENDELYLREMSRIKKGDLVAVGLKEDGTQGVYVDDAFEVSSGKGEKSKEKFSFMSSGVSREMPINYKKLVDLVRKERENGGYIIWVTGPAVILSRGRDDLPWLIDNGYVDAILAGNAVAVHDIEASIFKTTLGMTSDGCNVEGGHATHMRAINKVKMAGSIKQAVDQGIIKDGIMYSCVKNNIPFVLAGSIRDDGPLPDTITDTLDCQKAMREHTKKATIVIMIATMLHSIATGNMTPAYYEKDGEIRPLTSICVDQTEFVVNKLKDRGTHQAYGVVTNAQDFLRTMTDELKKKN